MKNTFRWLGLVATPLRIVVGGLLLFIFIIPFINKWHEINIWQQLLTIAGILLSSFLFFGLFTRLTASFILLLSSIKIFLPETFHLLDHQSIYWLFLLLASSFVIFTTGGGAFSIDHLLAKNTKIYQKSWFQQIAGGDIPLAPKQLKILTLTASSFFLITLIYIALSLAKDKKAVKAEDLLTADSINLKQNSLSFHLQYTHQQVTNDTVHLIYIKLFAENEDMVALWNNLNFQVLEPDQIYSNKENALTAGEHSLIVPAGAESKLTFYSPYIQYYGAGTYWLHLEDITGRTWKFEFQHKPL